MEGRVVYETNSHFVLLIKTRTGYEVYKKSFCYSIRCSQIGWEGDIGLNKAIAECERRTQIDKKEGSRMASKRPTARTLEFFRDKGYEVQIVERFVFNHRKDFLGCIDVLAMKENQKTIIGIQCFSTAWKEHERKLLKEFPEGTKFWLRLGHEFFFVGWRKLKLKRGGKAMRWTPRFGKVKLTKKGKLKMKEFKDWPEPFIAVPQEKEF